jgi:3-oxoacyl-[acyl-carrier protein] reductase
MDLQLNDKTALVTGSSKGIGEAIAVALAREGASVIVHGRDRAQTERVVNTIVANGGRAYAVLGDLTLDEEVERLVAEAEKRVGAMDILVNNAGGSGPKNDWQTTAIDGLEWAPGSGQTQAADLTVCRVC